MKADNAHLEVKYRKDHQSMPNGISNENMSNSTCLDLSNFSEEERKEILAVVKRDLDIQAMEKHRLK